MFPWRNSLVNEPFSLIETFKQIPSFTHETFFLAVKQTEKRADKSVILDANIYAYQQIRESKFIHEWLENARSEKIFITRKTSPPSTRNFSQPIDFLRPLKVILSFNFSFGFFTPIDWQIFSASRAFCWFFRNRKVKTFYVIQFHGAEKQDKHLLLPKAFGPDTHPHLLSVIFLLEEAALP